MDVTSLLNAGATAVVLQKNMDGQRIPGRNRTPWDAGGYSLPITTRPPISPPTEQLKPQYEDSQMDMPSPPWHKMSDSRGSFSSFASSIQSTTHSRFSSTSTVSRSHSIGSIAADMLSPKSVSLELCSPSGGNPPEVFADKRIPNVQSVTESLDALTAIGETRLSPQIEREGSQPSQEGYKSDSTEQPYPRPSSPSDAILIKRAVVPSLKLDTGYFEFNKAEFQQQLNQHYLSAPLAQHHQSLMSTRLHKRSASAPDIQVVKTDCAQKPIGPLAEPTPPSSYHPDHASPTECLSYPSPDTPSAVSDPDPLVVVCMYIPNCDTGSQPRKAISHIFGRNKMCTRLIPDHVWVHYCRKHYQRSRYRNPKEYAKLQCDLVQHQIRRIHDWSKENQIAGRPGTVRNWGLSLRKREQQRLDSLAGKRKRSVSGAGFDHESDGDDVADNGAVEGSVPATAVPKWILDKMGKGYDTQAILAMFHRLHTEILSEEILCFPDIEILPNICVNDAEPSTKEVKGYAKRKSAANAHKRSQSLGVAAKSDLYSPASAGRRPSHPNNYYSAEVILNQKRRRQNEFEDGSPTISSFSFGSRRIQIPHRPVFPNINEHQMAEDNYAQAERYFEPPQSYQAPLPAPTPQRYGAHQSMVAHLETGKHIQGTVHRGRQHQRSHSDMTSLNHRYSTSPSYSGSMQLPGLNAQTASGSCCNTNQVSATEAPIQIRHFSSPQPRSQQTYDRADYFIPCAETSRATRMGHMRHQSSPMVQPHFQNGRSLYTRQAQMHQLPSIGQMSEGGVEQGFGSGMRNLSHIYETQQARISSSAHR